MIRFGDGGISDNNGENFLRRDFIAIERFGATN